ncbi:hypothetical protein [Gordonia sp. MMO-8]|uniref:hypothetical protein n=1 Tax=Gordonia sp. MMO-8 TaxID=3127886 RepID=UPI00301612F4
MPVIKHPKVTNESVVIGGVRYQFDRDGYAETDEVTERDRMYLGVCGCEVLDEIPEQDGAGLDFEVDLEDLGVGDLSLDADD